MARINAAFETRAALMRLQSEIDRPGGFNEYAQFCEELLVEILPHLSAKGLSIVKERALENCRLESN